MDERMESNRGGEKLRERGRERPCKREEKE